MMKRKPFIKLFSCSAGKYFYDVNLNDIVEITDSEYIYLYRMINSNDFNESDIKNSSFPHIVELYNKGYFKAIYPEIIEHELTPYVKNYLSKRLQGVTLQVTQNCNFRCRYCSFSGNGYFDRKHNGMRMTKSIALKSIDFLKKNSIDLQKVRIGFYGGEPLLEFELVKEVVKYAKKIMPEKELLFTMTTNLSLLTDEMLEFIVENNFELAVSLDGPKEYHDRYRRFAIDGAGTYETVYNLLEEIHYAFPDYFKTKLTISAVIDGDDKVYEIQDFFNQGFLSKTRVNFSALDSSKTDLKKNPTQDFFNSYNENVFKSLINNYLQNEQAVQRKNEVLFSSSGDYDEFLKNIERKTSLRQVHHAGPCIPGQAKMLITVCGDIFTCEKASNNSNTMCIGNIDVGLDYDKIYSLLNVGKLTEEECKKCWAIRFCSACAINIDNFDSLSRDLKLKECKITLKRVETLLKNHVTINKLKEVQK